MAREEVCKIKILRFDPEREPSSYIQEYEIPFQKENTILDSLYYIYRQVDPTLAFRGSCFAGGWCNVCAVKVNGRPLLPCKQFTETEMTIEPFPGYPVLRDLIVDYPAGVKKRGGKS